MLNEGKTYNKDVWERKWINVLLFIRVKVVDKSTKVDSSAKHTCNINIVHNLHKKNIRLLLEKLILFIFKRKGKSTPYKTELFEKKNCCQNNLISLITKTIKYHWSYKHTCKINIVHNLKKNIRLLKKPIPFRIERKRKFTP